MTVVLETIGFGWHGQMFPGAVAPFGLVQQSPDTNGLPEANWKGQGDYYEWQHCSGYNIRDNAQSHRDCTTAFLPEPKRDLEHRPGADTSGASFYRQTLRQMLLISSSGERDRLRISVDFLCVCEKFGERRLNRRPDNQKAALPEASAPQAQEDEIDRSTLIQFSVTEGS